MTGPELNCAADTRTDAEREMDHLRHENDMLTKAGIIELAVRNPSVMEYMREWEGRAEKAEAELARIARTADGPADPLASFAASLDDGTLGNRFIKAMSKVDIGEALNRCLDTIDAQDGPAEAVVKESLTTPGREPVAWQSRMFIGNQWTGWRDCEHPARFRIEYAFNFDNGTAELRPLYTHPVPDGPAPAVSEAEEALKPFAQMCQNWSMGHLDGHVHDDDLVYVKAGDIRAAAAAFEAAQRARK